MKNRMSDLRNHLFETLEQLKDADNPMDLKRAETISHVAQTIIDSAKVEVAFLKTIDAGAAASDFFGSQGDQHQLIGEKPQPRIIPARRGGEG